MLHTSRRRLLRTLGAGTIATFSAPAIARAATKTWRIQSGWSSGVGWDFFSEWCASIVEKSEGELSLTPVPFNGLPAEQRLYSGIKAGILEAVNPFTSYSASLFPSGVFLTSYPLGLRTPHEWDAFYYSLGGLEIARDLFSTHDLHFVGPIHHGPNIIHSSAPIRSIDDFRGKTIRIPLGMPADVFTAIGAKTVQMPGPKIFPAFEAGELDIADYGGAAQNYEAGLSKVSKYISMGPPGMMSVYQPVDLMDLTVAGHAWRALSPQLKELMSNEVPLYSQAHSAAIQHADQQSWPKYLEDGNEVTRLSAEDIALMTGAAVPVWFEHASKDPTAQRILDIHLAYMQSGSLGYVDPEQIAWFAGKRT